MKKNKSNLYIAGKRIYLREIEIADADRYYCDWLNDPQVNKYLESRFKKWSVKQLKSYIRKVKKSKDSIFMAVILKDSNQHIGNIKLGPINPIHGFADMGIIIGEKSSWGKGLGSEAIRLAMNYAFNNLKIHKLTAGVYSNNIASIKAFKKAGFLTEGKREKHYLYNGKYIDAVLFGCIGKRKLK